MKRAAPLVSIALVLSACTRGADEKREKRLAKDPALAISRAAADALAHKPVPPVGFDALMPFLPAVPAGWTADSAYGESSRGMGFDLSTVRRKYRGPGTLEATITDTGYQPAVLMSVTMSAQLARETAEGYERGVTLAGSPGLERWRKEGSRAELTMVVGKRYLVTLRASAMPDGFARIVWKSMDQVGLANLK
jgi:hypothetical protein